MPKKRQSPRTNVMRLLDANQVAYEVLTFSPDIHSATGVAEAVALPPETVYNLHSALYKRGYRGEASQRSKTWCWHRPFGMVRPARINQDWSHINVWPLAG